MKDIKSTLEERGSSYGEYADVADYFMRLVGVASRAKAWEQLPETAKCTVIMVCMKIARALSGSYDRTQDTWHDIAGYATLQEAEWAKQFQGEKK